MPIALRKVHLSKEHLRADQTEINWKMPMGLV